MLYQLVHMGYYVLKHLQIHSFLRTAKQYAVDIVVLILVMLTTGMIPKAEANLFGWIWLAAQHAVVVAACVISVNFAFFRKESVQIFRKVMKKKNG